MPQSSTPVHATRESGADERERQRQEQIQRNQAALEWLKELDQGDPEEQRETWELIERMLREFPVRI
jgi:hypothetical protein